MGIENGNSSVQQDVPATDNDVRALLNKSDFG